MTAKTQKINACQEVRPTPIHKIDDDLRFSTCIGNFYKPQIGTLLTAQYYFEKGVMPYPGGLMDQPAKIIEIFNVISQSRAEAAAREQKKSDMMSRQKRGARG